MKPDKDFAWVQALQRTGTGSGGSLGLSGFEGLGGWFAHFSLALTWAVVCSVASVPVQTQFTMFTGAI